MNITATASIILWALALLQVSCDPGESGLKGNLSFDRQPQVEMNVGVELWEGDANGDVQIDSGALQISAVLMDGESEIPFELKRNHQVTTHANLLGLEGSEIGTEIPMSLQLDLSAQSALGLNFSLQSIQAIVTRHCPEGDQDLRSKVCQQTLVNQGFVRVRAIPRDASISFRLTEDEDSEELSTIEKPDAGVAASENPPAMMSIASTIAAELMAELIAESVDDEEVDEDGNVTPSVRTPVDPAELRQRVSVFRELVTVIKEEQKIIQEQVDTTVRQDARSLASAMRTALKVQIASDETIQNRVVTAVQRAVPEARQSSVVARVEQVSNKVNAAQKDEVLRQVFKPEAVDTIKERSVAVKAQPSNFAPSKVEFKDTDARRAFIAGDIYISRPEQDEGVTKIVIIFGDQDKVFEGKRFVDTIYEGEDIKHTLKEAVGVPEGATHFWVYSVYSGGVRSRALRLLFDDAVGTEPAVAPPNGSTAEDIDVSNDSNSVDTSADSGTQSGQALMDQRCAQLLSNETDYTKIRFSELELRRDVDLDGDINSSTFVNVICNRHQWLDLAKSCFDDAASNGACSDKVILAKDLNFFGENVGGVVSLAGFIPGIGVNSRITSDQFILGSKNAFNGVIDGNNKSILNLDIDLTSVTGPIGGVIGKTALFDLASFEDNHAPIVAHHLTIGGGHICAPLSHPTGGIVGELFNRSLYKVKNQQNILLCANALPSTAGVVGGVVGRAYTSANGPINLIMKAENYAQIGHYPAQSNAFEKAGGIVGSAPSGKLDIVDCRNSGEVYGSHSVGGIVGLVSGELNLFSVSNSQAARVVLVGSYVNGNFGGIVGQGQANSNIRMYNALNNGTVNVSKWGSFTGHAGGIAGKLEGLDDRMYSVANQSQHVYGGTGAMTSSLLGPTGSFSAIVDKYLTVNQPNFHDALVFSSDQILPCVNSGVDNLISFNNNCMVSLLSDHIGSSGSALAEEYWLSDPTQNLIVLKEIPEPTNQTIFQVVYEMIVEAMLYWDPQT